MKVYGYELDFWYEPMDEMYYGKPPKELDPNGETFLKTDSVTDMFEQYYSFVEKALGLDKMSIREYVDTVTPLRG